MHSHPYEYKVLVEYISPKEKGRFPHFTHAQDEEGLTRTLEDIFAHLPQSIPEGWEVNSHSTAISRNAVVLTVLLRRGRDTLGQ